jgi:hypothetical protein
MKVPDFRKAFRDGSKLPAEPYGEVRVSTRRIGRLTVTTGAIVACDPLVFPERRPFTRRVPPGRYPVVISIAHIRHPKSKKREKPDERIACAMLRLGPCAPVRWQMATIPGQKLRTLKEDHYYGYVVDAGTGCFMDRAAAKILDRRMEADHGYFEELLAASEGVYVHTRRWADFPLDEGSGLNVVFFSSGWGDGSYASCWGFDRAGEVACLVTDFQVLDRTTDAATGRPAPKG